MKIVNSPKIETIFQFLKMKNKNSHYFWTKFGNFYTSSDYVKVFVGIPLTG